MTPLQLLFAVLGLFGGAFSALAIYVVKAIRHNAEKDRAVMAGVQALLRAQMIADYNRWTDAGYAPIYARENFENCWIRYHALGANGVMDDLHRKFMELPTAASAREERI